MKRTQIGAVIAALLVVVSIMSVGGLATAQGTQRNSPLHGTPQASPMAMGPHVDTGTGAAFMTITNNGEDDRLVAASSDAAQVVEIHDMVFQNDVMSMVHLSDGLDIPAGESVELKPRGLHVMLIGLNQDLLPGDTFEITFTFERAGDVTVTAVVGMESPAAGESWTVGDIVVEGVWSRPAPRLSSTMPEATPDATPAA